MIPLDDEDGKIMLFHGTFPEEKHLPPEGLSGKGHGPCLGSAVRLRPMLNPHL